MKYTEKKTHTKFCVIQHQLCPKSVSQLLCTSSILIKSNEKDIIFFIGTNQGFHSHHFDSTLYKF